jgi:glycosyltransferase involved in cell wall biosynthesis
MSLSGPERSWLWPPTRQRHGTAGGARTNENTSCRVAHLLRKCDPAEWGGSEAAIERLCQGLQKHGVDSVIYCPRLDYDLPHEPWEHIACVRRFRAVIPVWGLRSEQRRQMIRLGGNLMSFELVGQLWREPNLKLIHAHALGRVGGIGLTLARMRRLPFVVTIHGGVMDLPCGVTGKVEEGGRSGFEWGKIFGLIFKARKILQEADAIVTCNPREAELLRGELPSKRIVVQPHGIPLALYRVNYREAALKAFPQLEGRQTFLCAGRLDPIKNASWLVEQWPEVLRRHPKALLVLAGPCTDPFYGAELERRIHELDLTKHVLLTGGLPSADPRLVGLFQCARALVLASRSETFGLVIIEAWAAGIPVIASRTSGACALLQSPRDGWLFDLEKPEVFQRAMDDILLRPRLVSQAVATNNESVSEHDQTVVGGRMKQLYDELTEEHHALRGLTR